MATSIPKVAHLLASLEIGGMERVVQGLMEERNARHSGRTYVYCLDMLGPLAEGLAPGYVRCFEADRSLKPFDRSCIRQLRQAMTEDGIEVLHSHNTAAFHYGALGTRLHPARHVYTQHGSYYGIGYLGRLKQRLIASLAIDHLVAVSHDTADKMAALQSIPKAQIQVIPNGILPHPAGPLPDLHLPADSVVLGSLGGLKPVKGWERFLPLLAPIMQEDPRLHLLLIGDGDLRDKLKAQAAELGIEDRLTITGYLTDARRYLDLLDIFLLPSHSEGTSMALLEAMAASLPCIVTDVGDSGLLVRAGDCGYILPAEQIKWPDQLQQAIRDPDREAKGKRGLAYVLEHHMVEHTLEAYERIYRSLR